MIKFYTFVMEIGIEENFLNLTKGLYKIYGVRSRYSGYLCIKSKCVGGAHFVVMIYFVIWLPICGYFVIIKLCRNNLDALEYKYYTLFKNVIKSFFKGKKCSPS